MPPNFDLAEESLGLGTVYILARRLEAPVEIESRNGTTFRIRLPLQGDVPLDPNSD